MKIALVHRYYPALGGVTTVVEYLKREFEKEHEVEVITNIKNVDEKNITYLPGNRISFYLNVFKYLKKTKFEVIHSQSFPVCFFAPFLKEKIFFSVQGYDEVYDKPKQFHILLLVYFATYARILGYRFVDGIVAISNLIKGNLTKKHDIKENKIAVIHNGVNTKRFTPFKVKRDNKEIRIFLYGSSKRKGFDLLVKWAPELIKQNKNLKFVIVGQKKDLPSNLGQYFEFHKNVPFKEMPKIFNSADIVLLPSICEPFGITAAEGMSCGKATIVSKMSGAAEIVENNYNGIVSSLEDFPKNILYLIKNPKERKIMGKKARENTIKKLSAEVVAKKHIDFYRQIIRK